MITYQQELDLSALAETLKQRPEINSVTYDPLNNHWLQTRFASDNIYVPFYRSGKCSITEATSPRHFINMIDRVNALMRELLKFECEPTTEIKNIVATAELDSMLYLKTLAIVLELEQTEYEPEQFPTLIYRGGESVVLVFSSGRIVCTGLTDLSKISSAVNNMKEIILSLFHELAL
jgi:transcription initiation factor TFIID TATA-box-binding protein